MIEQTFLELLKSGVPSVEQRVYALALPAKTQKPAIVFANKEFPSTLCNDSDKNYREWELHIYATGYEEVKTVKNEVLNKLKEFEAKNIKIADAFVEDAELFAQIINFTTGRQK